MTTRRANQEDGGPPSKRLRESSTKGSPSTVSSSPDNSDPVVPEANEAVLSVSPHVQGFDDVVKRRVKFCETFMSHERLIYSIDAIPSNIEWGQHKPFKNLSDTICAGSSLEKKPITVWIIGLTTQVYHMKSPNEVADQASVRILPTILSSGRKMNDLLARVSSLSLTTESGSADVIKVTAWQSKFVDGVKAQDGGTNNKHLFEQPTPFAEVYDAREGYADKEKMPKLALRDIKQRDLILVECSIKRYSPDRKRYSGWEKWKAYLEMKAVSLIASALIVPDEKEDFGSSSSSSICF
ncbi:hypothetical protein BJ138DRAFT_1116696 [Hygrophoropsis aurantiaca]|uniref:Uncharacterized protein n=1 Tax=Hygrophoropsis aurantiaca TaxID=72124 RepID=A0ACB8A299_9AGAM|nr:hypothetical protein BJ138DRAFT_1116696 [Hygrophoropsis aurantiaca]